MQVLGKLDRGQDDKGSKPFIRFPCATIHSGMDTVMFAISLVLVGTALAAPASEKMPVFDVHPGCHAAASLMNLNPERAKRCLDDETSARDELAKQWSSFPVADRARCSAEAQLDGAPSYVDLLECLTLAREAKVDEN